MAKRVFQIAVRKDVEFYLSDIRLNGDDERPSDEKMAEFGLQDAKERKFLEFKTAPNGEIWYIFDILTARTTILDVKEKFSEICDFIVYGTDQEWEEHKLEVKDMSIGEALEHIWQMLHFFAQGDEYRAGLENIWIKKMFEPVENEEFWRYGKK